jgi:hypothetical protein
MQDPRRDWRDSNRRQWAWGGPAWIIAHYKREASSVAAGLPFHPLPVSDVLFLSKGDHLTQSYSINILELFV